MALPELLGGTLSTSALTNHSHLSCWSFAFWVGPLGAANQVLFNTMITGLSRIAPQDDVGLTLGVHASLTSASGIVTPLVAAGLMKHHGFVAVPLAGAVLASTTVGTMLLASHAESNV